MDTLAASSPIDDAERLKALRLLNIDDKRLDESLGDVVRRVGELFETTVCFINLVFQDRQVFRSWFGGVPDELMRAGNTHERSLCTYVVEERAPLIIQDLLDSATWREPFDWSELIMNFYSPIGVRFYAGLPLITSGGHALGTLCLIDMRPRQMDAAALESLQFFAAKAAAELELATQSETTRRLRQELERTSKYASALSDLVSRLQQAADVRSACDAALSVIRDAGCLEHDALVAIDPTRVVSGAGAIPPGFPDGILRQHLGATEPRYLEGVAIVPLPATAPEGALVLIAGRPGDSPWTEADRFFLQSSSQLLASSLRRFSRDGLPDQAGLIDDLTGVGNRQAFDRLAGQPVDPTERWLLFVARLSGLKLLRETQGQPVGDFVLRRVAEALTRSVRPEDRGRLFRTGDDEFAIVVGAAASDATAISARFEKAVGEALRSYEGLRLRLDLGVAAIPDQASTISEAVTLLGTRTEERSPDATGLLSDRERQIMMMIVNGRRTKEIALELDISETTVATHRARLLKKMSLRDNRDLFRYALRHGLTE